MIFKCKVCAEKDQRILDLKNEVDFLRGQIRVDNNPENIPLVHMEADGVMSGQQHVITIPDVDTRSQTADEERAERDRLLSATY